MSDLSLNLKYKRNTLRVALESDGAWIPADDISTAINLKSHKAPVSRLADHQKSLRQIAGQGPRLRVLSVEGIQRLVGGTRVPGAAPFLEWFRAQAMPQIAQALQDQAESFAAEPDVSPPLLENAASDAVVVADVALDVGRAFAYGNLPVRLKVDSEGEILFNANDVCEALELTNPWKAVADHVDPDDLTKSEVIDAKGRSQQSNYVNLSGLYALIFGSQKEAARKFKRWVTHDVLPSIQKTGSYSLGGTSHPSASITSQPTEAQRLARLASAAALAVSINDSPEARKNQIQARQALAQVNQAEQQLRDMRIEIRFQQGINQPVAYTAYPAQLLTREGRLSAGKVLDGRAYILRMGGNLDRPNIRPVLVGEHVLTPLIENVKFLANQAKFGLDEWSNLEEWARRKVNAEKNRR
jgi:prophage antirepressor-like protein